jgi:N-acetylmuramoyl-L-alanine amidase
MRKLLVAAVVVVTLLCGAAGCGASRHESTAEAAEARRQQLNRKLRDLRNELAAETRRRRDEGRPRPASAGQTANRPAPKSLHAPSSARASASASALRGMVVAIDPGHNGANGAHPGAINRPVVAYADGKTKACDTTGTETNDGRLTESLFNLEVAKELATRLRADGIAVVMTRKTNSGVGPCIDERAAIGNRAGADAAISIHADGAEAAGDHGFDVIYPQSDELVRPSIAGRSRRLGTKVRDALVAAGIAPANYVGANGLDARDDLGGLNLSRVPKVFAELGNMRSQSEATKLESAAYRARLAAALATGIERFLSATR